MDGLTQLRVVLAHDWLFSMRGGEKVLEAFCQRWPDAPLYTLLHKPGAVSSAIEDRPLHTSFLQHFPRVERYYRHLLPLMPRAVNWRLPDCDLVLSSSHCVVKIESTLARSSSADTFSRSARRVTSNLAKACAVTSVAYFTTLTGRPLRSEIGM